MNMILSEYKQEVENEFGECTILQCKFDHKKTNCENTERRMVYKCVTWIDYWREMIGNAATTMWCSSYRIFMGMNYQGFFRPRTS